MGPETIDIEHEQLTAGLDTTTGHGADSVFIASGPRDPWGEECLTTLVDLLVNHAQVEFPLWSKTVGQAPEQDRLPLSFALARQRRLLKVHTNTFADEVQLPPGEIGDLFTDFSRWAAAHSENLSAWAQYHLETPRIIGVRRDRGPWDEADRLMPPRGGRGLSEESGIPEQYLQFGFQTFVRAIQYDDILGPSVPYFPHPVRERALKIPMTERQHPQWSWGRYFVTAMKQGRVPRRLEDVLDYVSAIREVAHKYNVNWQSLKNRPYDEQVEQLTAVAAEAKLPATLKDESASTIEEALRVGMLLVSGAEVLQYNYPIVGLLFGTGVVAVKRWRKEAPGELGKIKIFRGRLVWPGLLRP